jgi:hypothetical protein
MFIVECLKRKPLHICQLGRLQHCADYSTAFQPIRRSLYPAHNHDNNKAALPWSKVISIPFSFTIMDKVKPYIEDAIQRINKLSNEEKIAGVIGIASLVVLTSYLTKSSRKVQLGCTKGAKLLLTSNNTLISTSFTRTTHHW